MAEPRFLTPEDVAEILNTSRAQVYALIRRRELRAVKLGGRGQWRIERAVLDDFIEQLYADTERWIEAHPFNGRDTDAAPE